MTNKIIILITFVCLSIISCNKTPSDPVSIALHAQANVTTSRGINFDTGETVLLDSFTGERIESCGDFAINTENNTEDYNLKQQKNKLNSQTKETVQKCITQVGESPQKLLDILKLTRSGIKGTIIVNNKKQSVIFNIGVTALYNGSACETIYSGGEQYEICTSLEKKCSVYSSYTGSRRSRYDSKCEQFPFW